MADEPESPWIERWVAMAALLGFNPVRTRWKLLRWEKSWREARLRAGRAVTEVAYAHQVCPQCGAVQPGDSRRCSSCSSPLPTRLEQKLRRMGLAFSVGHPVTSFLVTLLVVVFIRMVLAGSGQGVLGFDSGTLIRFGAFFPPLVREGEYYRLGTALFLHIGLWHLGFNGLALVQVGPTVEELFGRGRALFLFLLTGLLANIGSGLFGLAAVQAGASGAILGWVGLVAGWGHRDGTTVGRNARNQMLKWGLYTVLYGIFLRADNAAHVVGFLSGGVLGWMLTPLRPGAPPRRHHLILGVAAGVTCLVAVGFILTRPGETSLHRRSDIPSPGLAPPLGEGTLHPRSVALLLHPRRGEDPP